MATDTPPSALAPLERTVVALGLRDPLWSVPGPRRWFRRAPADAERLHLANPRLESLRRMVVLLRHDRAVQGLEVDPYTLFSPGQIDEAEMMIQRRRAG